MRITTSKLIIVLLLSFSAKCYAQAPDTSTVEKLLHFIVQPLNKSQVPTGFLEECGYPILSAATFNGTLTDSNRIDINLWRILFLQLQTG